MENIDEYLINSKYLPTIGVECHVQLKTKTKLFAAVSNDARDATPNTLICPLCVGMPGTLPVLNSQAIRLAIRAGLALRAQIADICHFDRKHYFYPDLPKGYQISQFERPIVGKGIVEVPITADRFISVGITRAHLEEDAGKSIHPEGADYSLVDLNRTGTPLLEIVSEPDLHSASDSRAYVKELYLLMKYSDVSDVDLYHGNMRFDVNVSVSPDINKLGVRSETKNLNSFRSVEKAIEYEIKRQISLLDKGKEIAQETRGWDEAKQKTTSQRGKEDAHDYRYFPDPDIPPIFINKQDIVYEAENMPLLPPAIRERLLNTGLEFEQVTTILDEPVLADIILYVSEAHDQKTAKTIANWSLGELQRLCINDEISWSQVKQNLNQLVKLASMVDANQLSSTAAKDMILEVIKDNKDPEQLATDKKILQVSDESELVMLIEQVLRENQKASQDVKDGELKAIGFLVGQVMKASQGRANPAVVQKLIKKQLGV